MYRVMIVDDEMQVAMSLRRLLRREYDVAVCASGEDALSRADDFRPDLVITDFRMPGMNGAQLLSKLKANDPRIEGLIISGYADVESAVGAGVFRFIPKPWSNSGLLSLVAEMLRREGPAS